MEKPPINVVACGTDDACVAGHTQARPAPHGLAMESSPDAFCMNRKILTVALVASLCVSSFPATAHAAPGGLFARINKPIVPGVPVMPGLPTLSPLGLIAPRLSNVASIPTLGGFRTQAGRLAGLGVLAPRVSPLVALFRGVPATPRQKALYGLTILSPRAAVLVGMLQAARNFRN
jgi:hypothetical protein